MRAFALIRMTGGQPAIDPETTPLRGYCLGAQRQDWGLYMIAGTIPQLQAVNALPLDTVVGLCTTPNIDDTVSPTVRDNLNTWKDAQFPALPDLPPGWTNRQVIQELYSRANPYFDLPSFGLPPAEDEEP